MQNKKSKLINAKKKNGKFPQNYRRQPQICKNPGSYGKIEVTFVQTNTTTIG